MQAEEGVELVAARSALDHAHDAECADSGQAVGNAVVVRDGRVGKQTAHARLRQRGQVAKDHRQHGEIHEDHRPGGDKAESNGSGRS